MEMNRILNQNIVNTIHIKNQISNFYFFFLARYLTSEQALADYAYLIDHIRSSIQGAEESQTIVFGGSYGGVLAAYFRIKYSHIVAGAHASSAPILQMSTPCESFSRVN
jgi:lysosomal Pro-X carboxypeptidase